MDSAANCALAGLLIRVHHVASVARSCIHLRAPTRPALAVLFMLVAAFLDIESIVLIVISMCIMLLDFVEAWPFSLKSKLKATQDQANSKILYSIPEKRVAQDWKMNLDPEIVALEAALDVACKSICGPILTKNPTRPACKLIALGPALNGPVPKSGRVTARVLDLVSRIASASIPGAKVYGFERARESPGYPGGTMEIVVIVPCTALIEQLGERLQRGMRSGQMMLSSSQLHKSALRYLIDHLVNEGFKFRSSAFKAQEPAVAVSAPHGCCCGQGVYVSLSVNNPLPFLEASLMHEASVSDPRALPLIATVQRWAEARGLAHPVFGPLSMYGWLHACLFFLTQVAQPRMAPLSKQPSCRGFLEPDKGHSKATLADPVLLEQFFEFSAKFAYGRNHMWLRDKTIGPDAPFIEDALRPGIDLGYHLQHRTPRKQLQGEAANAALALKANAADIDGLAELAPLKANSGHRSSLHKPWENPAHSELRMMKKTRASQADPQPAVFSTELE